MPVVQVVLPVPLARKFDYLLPATLTPAVGGRVNVPFGNRKMVGIVVGFSEQSDFPEAQLKQVVEVIDHASLFPPSLWRILQWAADYYHFPLGEVLFHALPVLIRQGKPAQSAPLWQWVISEQGKETAPESLKNARKQQQALAMLRQRPIYRHEVSEFDLTDKILQTLRAKGLCELQEHARAQHDWRTDFRVNGERLRLNTEQAMAVGAIRAEDVHFSAWLLNGITGSGKTEVYLSVLENVLESGRQALVLVPEIGLTPQTIARFRERFAVPIDVLHSGLNEGERLAVWLRARQGETAIVIGTRSALFTPLARPGVIIIDEEHDSSYKQQEGLRYHARDLALVRARQEGIPILLGSATPSLESLHNAHCGRYGLLRMNQRAGGARQPRFLRLDVKSRPLDSGISGPLQQAIGQTLAAGQQVLVFLNRRGFAPTLLCHDCGWLCECPRCDARMTVHQRSGVLRCHHCGHEERIPRQCPQCDHVDLRPVGAGTERAEERLATLFPDYPVLRVDRDSTARKDAMQQLFATIQRGQPCILVGTQMLAKGHHFPRVTLVAVLDADGGLFSGDFRASERMAQMIVQVAGRAGRAEEPGKVIVQTHLAEHPLLVQLTEQGYFAFAEQAISERRAAGLPPFSHLALLRAEAHKPGQAEGFLDEACNAAQRLLAEQGASGIELLGPVPAPMERRAGRYRAQFLLQASARAPLHRLLGAWLLELEQMPSGRQVRWSLDVDPVDLY